MTSSSPASAAQPVEAPRDVAAWTRWFAAAEIPVLPETAEALEALRANEDKVDANSLGEMIAGDPLMTLKVLAYESGHRSRRVVTRNAGIPVEGPGRCAASAPAASCRAAAVSRSCRATSRS